MSEDLNLSRLHASLAREPGVTLAILFGSRARGSAGADSDADLAVLGDGIDVVSIATALARATGVSVDVVQLEGAPYPLLLEVLRDGVPVFEHEPGVYARFVSRSLSELETDLPNLRRMQRGFVERVATRGLPSVSE